MTPKQKAEKILEKHYDVVRQLKLNGFIRKALAKRSALISLEILLQPFLIDYEIREYWINVQTELKKL